MVGMEGALVSGMLNILANKLAPLVIKQYSSIVGVTKDLQDLQGLVEEINCWLDTTGSKTMDSGQLFNWLKQLKLVVYDVDDIIDEFHLEAEKDEADKGNHIVSKWLISKPKSFLFQCKAAHKIKAIKERFAAIVKQRTDFNAILNSLPDGLPIPHINRAARAIPTLPIVDEASVQGRGEEKHEIILKLVDNNSQHIIKIVSIIGLGGCGKTTLARLVFNDGNIVKKYFENRIWVHVSQEFDVEKLVEKLFEAISGERSERYPLQQMIKTISEKLTGKRYLLVLDDVWTEDRIQWEEFMLHIKSGAPGSSILLTTRNTKGAEAVDSTDPLKLQFLSEVDSWAVFSQSFGMAIKDLGSEFLDVGREIVNKCGGVPLAIKVLAGVLRNKRRIEEWNAMRDNNLLDVEDKEHRVSACLMLSCFHLPSDLKQCFIMCSLFPKGYLIYKEQLIGHWIAHNMINVTIGFDYLEDIGDEHFNSLVQVSFLQDVTEYNGIVVCKMHDLVHDLARTILHEEITTSVPEDATISTKWYRYFSLTGRPGKLLPEKVFHNARAIYVDKGNDIMFGKALKNAKHLRSIIVNHVLSTAVLVDIFQIKNLKYLEMSLLHCKALPEAISDIWSLQTMRLTDSYLIKLPKSIGKLQKLRTLNLSGCWKLKWLPDSIGECSMLSSIDLRNCREITALPNSIGRNEKLRVLRLGHTKIEKLPSSIKALRNLERLELCGCLELVELPEGIGNLEKLQVLDIEDCRRLEGMPVGIGRLSRLQKLDLFVVGEGEQFAGILELASIGRNSEDLFIRGIARVKEINYARRPWLKQKTNLQRLKLEWKRLCHQIEANIELEQAVLNGLEPPPGIKELEIHGYSGRLYARWMENQVGGGAQGIAAGFKLLKVMNLCNFPNLKHLYGLVELPCLEELEISLMPSLKSVSGGPFPSLVNLTMNYLPSLGEVWMVLSGEDGGSYRNCAPHFQQVRVGNCVTGLHITYCPKLPVGLESITSLRSLDVSCFAVCTMPDCLGELHSLQSLTIESCRSLISLPDSMCRLACLKKLEIRGCDALHQLPECLGELCSLLLLKIDGLPRLACLPESMCGLISLEVLQIRDCRGLTSLPQGMKTLSSLKQLWVFNCPGIKSLPEDIKDLTALKELDIRDCPDIVRRCERGEGEDWHLISHIPLLFMV